MIVYIFFIYAQIEYWGQVNIAHIFEEEKFSAKQHARVALEDVQIYFINANHPIHIHSRIPLNIKVVKISLSHESEKLQF